MKKIIAVCISLVLILSCTGAGMFSASAVTAAEEAEPYIYFETGIDTVIFYFWIENAYGITKGDFSLEYDSDVIVPISFVEGDDDYFYWEYDGRFDDVFYFNFDFGTECVLDEVDMFALEFSIVGDISDVTYVTFEGEIDGVSITFDPYPLEIIELIFGDVDIDGAVTASDARLVLRASVELEELTDTQVYLGDVDENGVITAADARMILRCSVGLAP